MNKNNNLSNKPKFALTAKNELVSWKHPGGKLFKLGPESLSDAELLSILIGTGIPKRSALQIAEYILDRFQSFRGMSGQDMKEYLAIPGINKVKCARIAATWEIARRIVHMVLKDREKYEQIN